MSYMPLATFLPRRVRAARCLTRVTNQGSALCIAVYKHPEGCALHNTIPKTALSLLSGRHSSDTRRKMAAMTEKFKRGVEIDTTCATACEGDGVTFPKKNDTLRMHYTGTLEETGAKCQRDSSVDDASSA